MKSINVILAVSIFMAGAMLTGCQSSGTKVENAENKLQDAKNDVHAAKQDLNQAIKDTVTEYQKFKVASDEKIATHEKNIAEFKTKIANEKKENRAVYERKLANLEKKNSNMKKKLANYKAEEKDNWEKFKIAYNRDMENLSTDFRELTVKKVK